jgi:hypothetical protein
MPFYFRIPLPGPFGYSKRIGGRKRRGPTAAQKRAAATAQEQRARQREFNRTHTETVEYLQTVQGTDSEIAVFGRESLLDGKLHLHLRQGPVPVVEGTWVTITYRSGNLLEIKGAEVPASVAARRAARADHDARTYRGRITNCKIDGVTGGSFDVEADGRDNLHINVQKDTALRFLSLKNGDIVQVTLAKENAGIEEFWHLSRANGSKPRSPANFGPGEMTSRRVPE